MDTPVLQYCHMIMRLILTELVGGFLALPVWWYTRGLSIMSDWVRRTIREASEMFALGVWVRNLFVPMYGETEWSGKIISFGVRIAMIFVRGVAVAFWTVLALGAFAAYLVSLPLAVIGALYHGTGLLFF